MKGLSEVLEGEFVTFLSCLGPGPVSGIVWANMVPTPWAKSNLKITLRADVKAS